MPESSLRDEFKINLQTYKYENYTLKGIMLTNNEYALLRGVPPQTIIEEQNKVGNRIQYRKAIYLKEEKKKKIFVCSEKPLYTHHDAKIFRLEKLCDNIKKEIVKHETHNILGYWINKKEYCELTN